MTQSRPSGFVEEPVVVADLRDQLGDVTESDRRPEAPAELRPQEGEGGSTEAAQSDRGEPGDAAIQELAPGGADRPWIRRLPVWGRRRGGDRHGDSPPVARRRHLELSACGRWLALPLRCIPTGADVPRACFPGQHADGSSGLIATGRSKNDDAGQITRTTMPRPVSWAGSITGTPFLNPYRSGALLVRDGQPTR